ncbi:MAG: hypothetical protein A4E66_02541 [Syntrophus sp. PtaB.Bin001]|nr:MAG: hypothetical protein A4E66_02541 [Syntrophus sp. PtaB.Bin001]
MIQRDAVHQVRPQSGCLPRNGCHVKIVDSGDDDGIDLDLNFPFLELADRLYLIGQKEAGGVQSPVHPGCKPRPGVNLTADLNIDGIDRNRHMAYLQIFEIGGVPGNVQSVRCHTEHCLRIFSPDQPQGLQRFRRIGERIARPCDADD